MGRLCRLKLGPDIGTKSGTFHSKLLFGTPAQLHLTEYASMPAQSEEQSEPARNRRRVVWLRRLCGAKCWQGPRWHRPLACGHADHKPEAYATRFSELSRQQKTRPNVARFLMQYGSTKLIPVAEVVTTSKVSDWLWNCLRVPLRPNSIRCENQDASTRAQFA